MAKCTVNLRFIYPGQLFARKLNYRVSAGEPIDIQLIRMNPRRPPDDIMWFHLPGKLSILFCTMRFFMRYMRIPSQQFTLTFLYND